MQFLRAPLFLLFLVPVAVAQTFIVDAANGPGTHFTDLATATATVPDGAVIEVRPGTYGSFTIASKAMSILFDIGVTVASAVPVTVTGTAPHQAVVLRGMRVSADLVLTACQGLVLLSGCNLGLVVGGVSTAKLRANGCAQLLCDTCFFSNVLMAPNAPRASLDNCVAVFRGCSAASNNISPMNLRTSSMQLIDCDVAVVGLTFASPITLLSSDLRIVGGSLYASFNACISGVGSARVDPSVGHNNVLFESTVQGAIVAMPAAVTAGGALGSNVTATMRGPSGDVGVLLVGLPGPLLFFPGIFDPIWLQPGTEAVCAFAVFAAGVPLTVVYPVPNVPAMRGMRFCWQGATFGATNGLQASNPAITTHW